MTKTYFRKALVVVCFCINSTSLVEAATLQNAKALQWDLTNGHNKRIRPVQNQSDRVDIQVGLSLIALQEFDEVLGKFSVVGVFELYWQDQNMMWDSANYSGINRINLGYEDVWKPELILTNPSDKLDSFGKHWQDIRFSSNGWAEWYPADLIKSTCSVNVHYFPFDVQECKIETYVWAYNAFEIKITSIYDTVDIVGMAEHGTWTVIGTEAKAEVDGLMYKETFTFRLARKPQYVIVNVMLPILLLCLLNVLVFVLPSESGERVSYCITVLLSIAVFMTIVSDILSKAAEPLPLVSYYLMIVLILSSIIAFTTIFNLRLFHKKSDAVVPYWLVRVYHTLSWQSCKLIFKRNNVQAIDLNENNNAQTGSEISNTVTILEQENVTKAQHFHGNTMKDDTTGISAEGDICTWQDISEMVDYIALFVSATVSISGFFIFLILTKLDACKTA